MNGATTNRAFVVLREHVYQYRKLTPEQKAEVLRQRQLNGYPLHSPPHLHAAEGWFLITAATYEHKHYFTAEEDRAWLLEELFKELGAVNIVFAGWVVLPNHYHLLVQCNPLATISEPLRRVHARTARELNRREKIEGRQVWYRFSDRLIRDERHYYTTLNYIHYNPVKHGYVKKALDWNCSSVHWYVEHFGIEWLRDTWQKYPVRDYGKGWD
jgi:putative transposase